MTTDVKINQYEIDKSELDRITAGQPPCSNCGGPRVAIRARRNEEETRIVCPTCLAEAVDALRYSDAVRRVM